MRSSAAGLSIHAAFSFGWKSFRAHPGLFTGIFGTLFASWVVLEILVISSQQMGAAVNVLLHVLFLAFFSGLKLGFFRIALAVEDGDAPRYRDLFGGLQGGPRLLGAGLVYLLGVGLGLALLIVPGVYLALRYSQFGFAMAAEDSGVGASFRRSGRLTRGSLPTLLAAGALLAGINLVGVALLGLGLIVSVPVTVLAMASLYRQLETGPAANHEQLL